MEVASFFGKGQRLFVPEGVEANGWWSLLWALESSVHQPLMGRVLPGESTDVRHGGRVWQAAAEGSDPSEGIFSYGNGEDHGSYGNGVDLGNSCSTIRFGNLPGHVTFNNLQQAGVRRGTSHSAQENSCSQVLGNTTDGLPLFQAQDTQQYLDRPAFEEGHMTFNKSHASSRLHSVNSVRVKQQHKPGNGVALLIGRRRRRRSRRPAKTPAETDRAGDSRE